MRARHAGFSLIEVLVAFAILALSLGVLMDIFGGGLRNLGTSSAYTRAMLLAQSRLAEYGASVPLRAGSSQGDFDTSYRWRADVAEQPAVYLGVALYRIHLEVLWGPAADPRRVELDTLRIAPAT